MKKVLIFGVDGFSGIHLWEYLKKHDKRKIVGTYNRKPDALSQKRLKGCSLKHCDINNFSEIKQVLKSVNPQQIYFLPALVTVAGAFDKAISIYTTNILGSAKFLEAVVAVGIKPKILITGSAEEYGKVKKAQLPIKEQQPLNPANPYGLSKTLQERLAWYYVNNHQLSINMTRTFHFAGPYQPSSFVVSDFARQVAGIESGRQKPLISVGNLNAKRDFTDIRDVVKAYHLIMNKVKSPEAINVCRGRSVRIKDILNQFLKNTEVKIAVKKDPKKMRKLDVPDFRGSNRKLIAKTGWKPGFDLNQTIADVLNQHRKA